MKATEKQWGKAVIDLAHYMGWKVVSFADEQTETCGACGVYITNKYEVRVGLCTRCARDEGRGESWE